MLNFSFFITSVLLFITQSQSFRVLYQNGHEYLEDIFHFYGGNSSISTENLDNLLQLISERRSDSVTVDNPLENQEVST